MTLHDKVAIESAIGAARYLLDRAQQSVNDAWKLLIENAEYCCNEELCEASRDIREASEQISSTALYLKENYNDVH